MLIDCVNEERNCCDLLIIQIFLCVMTNIHCASGLCQSDSRKSPNLKFANFPKPKFGLDRAKRWIHLFGRRDFHVENIKS